MQFSRDELAEIVVQASSLAERSGGNYVSTRSAEDDDLIAARLKRWRTIAARDNSADFEKRLAWDGWDDTTVHRVLGSMTLADRMPLPGWAELLNAILKTISPRAQEDQPGYRFLNGEAVAFDAIFAPFVDFAGKQLIDCAGSSYARLSEAAQIALEHDLLKSLSSLCTAALDRSFSRFRGRKRPLSVILPPAEQPSGDTAIYSEYVDVMLGGQLLVFFRQYPVLARLIPTLIQAWVAAIAAFLVRLDGDWAQIAHSFANGAALGNVTRLDSGLSDAHNGRQGVIQITFSIGLRLIYKPKNVELEVAFSGLVKWLNARGLPLALKAVKVLQRSSYGWAEFIERLPCDDEQAGRRFYQRAGMLLCLIYALKGTDCHMENLIAHGEYPVLVDMETLIYPKMAVPVEQAALSPLVSLVWDSVLVSAMLPEWRVTPDGQDYDMSGLANIWDGEMLRPTWVHINSDDMALCNRPRPEGRSANRPYLVGHEAEYLSPGDYLEEILVGFRQMYALLLEHRITLLQAGADNPLTAFEHRAVRFIFRDTRIYAAVLSQSLRADCLESGVERSIAIDALSRAFLQFEDRPVFWPILKAEEQAVSQMDIPFFLASTDSPSLAIGPAQTIDSMFEEASYETLIAHLKRLSTDDLERQLHFIRGSMDAYSAINVGEQTVTPTNQLKALEEPTRLSDLKDAEPLQRDTFVSHALQIAHALRNRAITTDNGVCWVSFVPTAGQRYRFQLMGYDLYAGYSGVILFLAALEKLTLAGFRDLALAATQPTHALLRNRAASRFLATSLGIGGAAGIASMIYAYVQAAQFLDAPILLEDAQRLAALITPDLIAEDRHLDVMTGAAGAILGLLALYRVTGDPVVLDQAAHCGQHLLQKRVPGPSGERAWPTEDDKLLTGFSHGAAGIAYSLLRLYEVTQDSTYRDAACEAIGYEQSVYCSEAGTWPDFRRHTPAAPAFGRSWCHGAPGIGLARIGSLAALDIAKVREDIDIALESTRNLPLQGVDHLCCGTLGRIETLLVGGIKLARPDLLQQAYQSASWVVTQACENGGYTTFANMPRRVLNLGFFQGIAGIGYELLRVAYPSVLPSVLLWE